MSRFCGLTSSTPERLLLDAGAFYKNFDVTQDTPSTASAKLLGATSGGGSFNATPTVRDIEVDGAVSHVKGLQVIDEWEVTMVANCKEVTADNIKLALGAATVTTTTVGSDSYKKITPKDSFDAGSDGDYLTNITWIGKLKSGDDVIIVLKNGISLNGLSLSVADKAEATIPITITACQDLSDMDVEDLFEIYYPA